VKNHYFGFVLTNGVLDGWLGIHCNEYNYIEGIQLDQLGLSGTIPDLVKDLRFLETL